MRQKEIKKNIKNDDRGALHDSASRLQSSQAPRAAQALRLDDGRHRDAAVEREERARPGLVERLANGNPLPVAASCVWKSNGYVGPKTKLFE